MVLILTNVYDLMMKKLGGRVLRCDHHTSYIPACLVYVDRHGICSLNGISGWTTSTSGLRLRLRLLEISSFVDHFSVCNPPYSNSSKSEYHTSHVKIAALIEEYIVDSEIQDTRCAVLHSRYIRTHRRRSSRVCSNRYVKPVRPVVQMSNPPTEQS